MPRKSSKQCPICGKPATAEAAPFCSSRCADRDLAHWIEGKYAIPVMDEDSAPEDFTDNDENGA